jgi:hypothetical protein
MKMRRAPPPRCESQDDGSSVYGFGPGLRVEIRSTIGLWLGAGRGTGSAGRIAGLREWLRMRIGLRYSHDGDHPASLIVHQLSRQRCSQAACRVPGNGEQRRHRWFVSGRPPEADSRRKEDRPKTRSESHQHTTPQCSRARAGSYNTVVQGIADQLSKQSCAEKLVASWWTDSCRLHAVAEGPLANHIHSWGMRNDVTRNLVQAGQYRCSSDPTGKRSARRSSAGLVFGYLGHRNSLITVCCVHQSVNLKGQALSAL